MNKLIFGLITTLFFSSAFAIPKSLKFATEATYPPFEYINESGLIQGFDVEIAYALCQQMQTQCEFSNQSFNSLIPSLQMGKFDAVMGAMGVTEERLKQVNFTHSYYEPSASFVGLLTQGYSLNQLSGKVIGVQQGSTFESYLHHQYGHLIKVKAYGSIQEAFLDLDAGRVDMVIADTPIALAWLKNSDKKFGIIDKPIIDHQYFGTGYGIAVNKNNLELLNALNKALAEIKKNGVYEKIYRKYF